MKQQATREWRSGLPLRCTETVSPSTSSGCRHTVTWMGVRGREWEDPRILKRAVGLTATHPSDKQVSRESSTALVCRPPTDSRPDAMATEKRESKCISCAPVTGDGRVLSAPHDCPQSYACLTSDVCRLALSAGLHHLALNTVRLSALPLAA